MQKLQPLNDQVILKPAEAEKKSAGGLYLPDSSLDAPPEGTVEALPSGGVLGVAIGDRVIYRPHAGNEIKVGGQTYRAVPSGDLLAKYVEVDAIPD